MGAEWPLDGLENCMRAVEDDDDENDCERRNA
jgi:hypothetical protein